MGQGKLTFRRVKVKDLKEYANNPRENDGAVGYVENSIHDFGYRRPIIVDEGMVILAGHTRIRALRRMGVEEVMVGVVEGLTEEQKTAFRIKDNRAGELTLFDFEMVAKEIAGIAEAEIDMTRFGFEPPRVEPPDGSEVTGAGAPEGLKTGGEGTGLVVCPRCGKVVE